MGPLDIVIVGTALNTYGFTANNTIDGTGLNTFGFLWDCYAIWTNSDAAITTTWTGFNATTGIEVCAD